MRGILKYIYLFFIVLLTVGVVFPQRELPALKEKSTNNDNSKKSKNGSSKIVSSLRAG